jgi:polysaccharide export outer membrane protein
MIRANVFSAAVVSLLLGGGAAILQAQAIETPAAANLVAANAANVSNATRSSEAEPQLEQRYPRYVIQRQDVLKLSFPLSPEMNQTVTVQPDGYISLQNAGGLHVQGLTVPELIAALKKAYIGVLHDPIVNVDIEDFQRAFFTVSGQVGKPGKYDLRSDITVAEALAIAGGMTPEAKTQVFLFHRTANGWVETRKLNMKDILRGKNVSEDASIKPGDMIYVPEKFIANFKKYVPYSLNGGTYVTPLP